MKNSILFTLLSVLFSSAGMAQAENKEIIIGCWEVRQVIFTKEVEGSDDISMDALGTIVCFEKNGKFTNKSGETIIKGNYSLSQNGRTLYQKMESDPDFPSDHVTKDIPGQIMMLSDRELQIQVEEMILYLRRGDE